MRAPIEDQIEKPHLIHLVEPKGHRVRLDEGEDLCTLNPPDVQGPLRVALADVELALP